MCHGPCASKVGLKKVMYFQSLANCLQEAQMMRKKWTSLFVKMKRRLVPILSLVYPGEERYVQAGVA